MIIRLSFSVCLIFLLFIHTLYGMNPTYLQQHYRQQQLQSLIDSIDKQLDDQHFNSDSSELNQNNVDDDDDQLIKRNKYPTFRVSPLWLSRRTRTNRFYGKPLWISRPG